MVLQGNCCLTSAALLVAVIGVRRVNWLRRIVRKWTRPLPLALLVYFSFVFDVAPVTWNFPMWLRYDIACSLLVCLWKNVHLEQLSCSLTTAFGVFLLLLEQNKWLAGVAAICGFFRPSCGLRKSGSPVSVVRKRPASAVGKTPLKRKKVVRKRPASAVE